MEDQDNAKFLKMPALSPYERLKDLQVEIPNSNFQFSPIASDPIEVTPISEHYPIDFGGSAAS